MTKLKYGLAASAFAAVIVSLGGGGFDPGRVMASPFGEIVMIAYFLGFMIGHAAERRDRE